MARLMMQSFGQVRPLSFDPRTNDGPVLASANTRWAGIPFEVHDLPPIEGPYEVGPIAGERGMVVTLQGSRSVVFQVSGPQREVVSSPGMVGFADGALPLVMERTTGRSRAVFFNIPSIWHERLLADGGPESFARLPAIPPHETAHTLALTICSEVKGGASTGALFAESLSIALLRYAIERLPPTRMRVRKSFSDGQRRRLARYIDERLQEDVTLTELATLIGLRPRHFSTLFRSAFGVSPHHYLIERRLEQGARLLASTGADIAEIALHVGFSSQSHFAAAFRRRYGMSPRRYALSRRSTFAGS